MTKTEYAEYLQSEHWQKKRKEAIALYCNACMNCLMPRWLSQAAYGMDLHVHHTSYANLGNESLDDLLPLCPRCHELETFGRSDFRELPHHECPSCSDVTWNPYEDYCDKCLHIFGRIGDSLSSDFAKQNPINGRPMWEHIAIWLAIFSQYSDVSVDQIAGSICRHRKKLEERAKLPLPF